MERMLVTQALDERDLLKKRIRDAIMKGEFVSVKRPNDSTILGGSKISVEDFEKDAKSQLQKITDLIDRYERLDSAILLANATEKIEVGDMEMSRASAINLRKSIIKASRLSDTDFRSMMIEKLQDDLRDAKSVVAKSQLLADKQREVMAGNISSNDKKEFTESALKSIESYCSSIVNELVDPIDAQGKLDDLISERDCLIKNLESAIKISNATTYVEF